MTKPPPFIQALAAAASPLVIELCAGLLERPVPSGPEPSVALPVVYQDLENLLQQAVPALQDILGDLQHCPIDDLEETIDELRAPALDLVDMARYIWQMPLAPQAEGIRPFLARLAEVPVVELISILQPIMHAAVDPWAYFDSPEEASIELYLTGNYRQERSALHEYLQRFPDLLPAQS